MHVFMPRYVPNSIRPKRGGAGKGRTEQKKQKRKLITVQDRRRVKTTLREEGGEGGREYVKDVKST